MKHHALLCSAVIIISIIACASPPGAESQNPPDRAVDQRALGATLNAQERSLSPGDADAIATFLDLPARWNRAAAPLVRDYLDPNVSADRWVREASYHIGELRAVHVEMRLSVLAIQDPGVKKTLEELAVNYRTKLDCLTALHNAVAQGSEVRELQAQQDLSEAAAEGQRLAEAWLDRVRPYVDPQVLADEMSRRGKAIGELMKPR